MRVSNDTLPLEHHRGTAFRRRTAFYALLDRRELDSIGFCVVAANSNAVLLLLKLMAGICCRADNGDETVVHEDSAAYRDGFHDMLSYGSTAILLQRNRCSNARFGLLLLQVCQLFLHFIRAWRPTFLHVTICNSTAHPGGVETLALITCAIPRNVEERTALLCLFGGFGYREINMDVIF